VNVLQSSKNVHKPRSVTWKEPVSDLRHKEKSEGGSRSQGGGA
jgi:hypothetical protein